ncbi:MAG: malonate decarboxylase subunit alpha [Syntrophales bacterium]|jgi:propionate CoA-transferase|nr:malonate decarboxylase subunit alpha [Syntrophales bacterium]
MENAAHPMLALQAALKQRKGKIVSSEEAVRVIRSGDTIAVSGFLGAVFAEEIARKIEESYLKCGNPRDLTLFYAAGIGDGKDKGVNILAHEGLLKKVVCGHVGLAPKLQRLIRENKLLAYNLPQGVINHLTRDIAAHKPGTLSFVGLGTFIDPRLDGGKLNDLTKMEGEDHVQLITVGGKECLFYRAFPINVAVVRGTTADPDGNITMEKEALTLETLSLAMAAKNSGGFVIAQVERIADRGTLNARQVKIPGIFVDCIVVAKPEYHWQTNVEVYNPAYSSEIRIPMQSIAPMEMSERKIIARRAAFELRPNSVVNLGIGMPEGVAQVANEEKIIEYLTLTAEPGVIGGMPNSGPNFGTGVNLDALIDQPYQFDFYDGGGLDMAFLGMAQADREGNINVSRYGPRFVGPGGFIDISQNSKKVIFTGTFTAGGLNVGVEDGKLRILSEGKERKFIQAVEQKTYSGAYGAKSGRPVLYVTERCVFRLTTEGLELIEIAPGVDLEKDVLSLMDFRPLIKGDPCLMNARIFRPEPMNLKDDLLSVPLEERFTYHPEENTFFVNFENFFVRSREDIEKIRDTVEKILVPIGKKVFTIVNYDNFNIQPELVDEYADMVKYVMRYYEKTTRYTTSTFLRMKLGDELQERGVAPHICENRADARRKLLGV